MNIKDPVTDNNSNQVLTINKATTTTAGVMSAADKTKLDGLSNYDDSTITQDITNIKANKLETIEVTGTGNVITTVTKNGTKIAFAKGITAMTQDTSDARYVKKTGDTMSGRLNIKTPASTGFTLRLAKETSDTPKMMKYLFVWILMITIKVHLVITILTVQVCTIMDPLVDFTLQMMEN